MNNHYFEKINYFHRYQQTLIFSFQVTWSAPLSANGIIQQYRVSYWRRGDESSVTQLAIPSSQSTCNITGLTPYTVYCVQVGLFFVMSVFLARLLPLPMRSMCIL